jgi:uracil phosphoribosyltransferase
MSKKLKYTEIEVQTPLGTCNINVPVEQPVIGTILRAGLPFQQGFLNFSINLTGHLLPLTVK